MCVWESLCEGEKECVGERERASAWESLIESMG